MYVYSSMRRIRAVTTCVWSNIYSVHQTPLSRFIGLPSDPPRPTRRHGATTAAPLYGPPSNPSPPLVLCISKYLITTVVAGVAILCARSH